METVTAAQLINADPDNADPEANQNAHNALYQWPTDGSDKMQAYHLTRLVLGMTGTELVLERPPVVALDETSELTVVRFVALPALPPTFPPFGLRDLRLVLVQTTKRTMP